MKKKDRRGASSDARQPLPTLIEHECKTRGEPVPAVRHKNGSVECIASASCGEAKEGRCRHGGLQ